MATKRPRTAEDFLLFCKFILDYENYEMLRHEELRSKSGSPMGSTGSSSDLSTSSRSEGRTSHNDRKGSDTETGFSFGGAPAAAPAAGNTLGSSFSFGKSATVPAASTPFSFGGPAASTAANAPATQPSSFSFGGFGSTPAQPANPTAVPSTGMTFGSTATKSSSFGGFGLGSQVNTPAAATTATPLSSGFSFGSTPVANTAPEGLSMPSTGFGMTAPSTQSAQPQSFGGTLGMNLNTVANQAPPVATTTKVPVAGGFNFGAPSQVAPSTTAAVPSAGFPAPVKPAPAFNFGAPATATSAPTAPVAPLQQQQQPQPPVFTGPTQILPSNGLSFPSFTTPSAAAPAATATPVAQVTGSIQPSAASTVFTHNSPITAPTAKPGFTLPGTTPSSAAPNLAFALGHTGTAPSALPPSAPSVTTVTAAPSTTGIGFALPTITPVATSAPTSSATAAPVAVTTVASTTAPPAPASTLTFRQLEDNINQWALDLEEQEKAFLQQASTVTAWDKLLVNNGQKIIELSEAVERVKCDQLRLDNELDFGKSQQRELEELLVPLEQALENGPLPDPEREYTYGMAENIDTQLRSMAEDLREIIENINASGTNQDPNDPLVKIGRILNAHTDSLQWVENSITTLHKKLDDVSKEVDQQRRQERLPFA
nr:EOG090X0EZJ [Lepidurus arcticus]